MISTVLLPNAKSYKKQHPGCAGALKPRTVCSGRKRTITQPSHRQPEHKALIKVSLTTTARAGFLIPAFLPAFRRTWMIIYEATFLASWPVIVRFQHHRYSPQVPGNKTGNVGVDGGLSFITGYAVLGRRILNRQHQHCFTGCIS